MPFEQGNTLAANNKGKLIHATIKRAVLQDDGKRIRQGVERMLDLYAAGDPFAMIYIRDTLDGKPAQSLTVSGDDDKPLITMIKMVIVEASQGETIDHCESEPIKKVSDYSGSEHPYPPTPIGAYCIEGTPG